MSKNQESISELHLSTNIIGPYGPIGPRGDTGRNVVGPIGPQGPPGVAGVEALKGLDGMENVLEYINEILRAAVAPSPKYDGPMGPCQIAGPKTTKNKTGIYPLNAANLAIVITANKKAFQDALK
jgi:hypothetical protein